MNPNEFHLLHCHNRRAPIASSRWLKAFQARLDAIMPKTVDKCRHLKYESVYAIDTKRFRIVESVETAEGLTIVIYIININTSKYTELARDTFKATHHSRLCITIPSNSELLIIGNNSNRVAVIIDSHINHYTSIELDYPYCYAYTLHDALFKLRIDHPGGCRDAILIDSNAVLLATIEVTGKLYYAKRSNMLNHTLICCNGRPLLEVNKNQEEPDFIVHVGKDLILVYLELAESEDDDLEEIFMKETVILISLKTCSVTQVRESSLMEHMNARIYMIKPIVTSILEIIVWLDGERLIRFELILKDALIPISQHDYFKAGKVRPRSLSILVNSSSRVTIVAATKSSIFTFTIKL